MHIYSHMFQPSPLQEQFGFSSDNVMKDIRCKFALFSVRHQKIMELIIIDYQKFIKKQCDKEISTWTIQGNPSTNIQQWHHISFKFHGKPLTIHQNDQDHLRHRTRFKGKQLRGNLKSELNPRYHTVCKLVTVHPRLLFISILCLDLYGLGSL